MNENVAVVAGQPSVSMGDPGILWSPIAAPARLRFSGTSCEAVAKALTQAFGPFPIRLHKGEQVLMLKGMIAAAGDGKQPYEELLLALTNVGQLEITQA